MNGGCIWFVYELVFMILSWIDGLFSLDLCIVFYVFNNVEKYGLYCVLIMFIIMNENDNCKIFIENCGMIFFYVLNYVLFGFKFSLLFMVEVVFYIFIFWFVEVGVVFVF